MPKAIRDVYGEVLVELGAENKNIVVLDADLAGSTRSGKFGSAYPDRFFDMGIAESNMVSAPPAVHHGRFPL
jgi:transketolase